MGLATKILPHNFNDLCRAAINHLQGKNFRILPDFPTGGIADFSAYNDGERGGKVKVRVKIEERSKYLLAITELPFGVTTESLIESILAANAKGKIKIKHVDDNTADKVEILIHLPQGADPDKVIAALPGITVPIVASTICNSARASDRTSTVSVTCPTSSFTSYA